MIKLYNTLTKEVEIFNPIDRNHIGMYFCGPTLHDAPHIGNLRTSVVADILYRILRLEFPKVTYVRNYTDIDDKIINKMIELDNSWETIVNQSRAAYISDMYYLGNLPPTYSPVVSDNIDRIIDLIKILLNFNYAYENAGHVFFETAFYHSIGELSGRDIKSDDTESRIGLNPYKRNKEDFVLWKPAKENEMGYDSPWGFGRPGWHIECSAMAKRYLGNTFDIHGGGVDLKFPHHENEIVQSCAAHSTERMANYWIHSGMVDIQSEKMSKSLNNIIRSSELKEKNISGDALRLLFLSTHYRTNITFTWDKLNQHRTTLTKWYEKIKTFNISTQDLKLPEEIKDLLFHDLNTTAVITKLNEYYDNNKIIELLSTLRFLGFKLQPILYNDKNVLELLKKRLNAKVNKNYELADQIRDEILSNGFKIRDKPETMEVIQKYQF